MQGKEGRNIQSIWKGLKKVLREWAVHNVGNLGQRIKVLEENVDKEEQKSDKNPKVVEMRAELE